MNTIHTNAPEVLDVARRAFPGYSGKTYKVEPFNGPMSLRSTWDSGCHDQWVILPLAGRGRTFTVPENGNPFINGGKTFKCGRLPAGLALVHERIFQGKNLGLTVYVAPENMNRLALPPAVLLSLDEKIVLAFTSQRKSSYNGRTRAQMAQEDSGITASEWDTAKAGLISRGLLNRAGVITNEGRNAIGSLDCNKLKKPHLKRYDWQISE